MRYAVRHVLCSPCIACFAVISAVLRPNLSVRFDVSLCVPNTDRHGEIYAGVIRLCSVNTRA